MMVKFVPPGIGQNVRHDVGVQPALLQSGHETWRVQGRGKKIL